MTGMVAGPISSRMPQAWRRRRADRSPDRTRRLSLGGGAILLDRAAAGAGRAATIGTRARSSAGFRNRWRRHPEGGGQGPRHADQGGAAKGLQGGAVGLDPLGRLHQHHPAPGIEERHRRPAGTTAPGDYVLYSAHWDHLGRCDAVDGDDICNGALDNATGVAGLVALAEAQAKAGPAKRSIAFLAVTAEKAGCLVRAIMRSIPSFRSPHRGG